MFTQPCFIRKYSKDLCKILESFGLELMNSGDTTLDNHNYDGKGSHRSIEDGRAIITYQSNYYGVIYDIDAVTKKGRVDCGTNEELFLAIAALRDDSDYMQYFVSNNDPEMFLLCYYKEFHFFGIDPDDAFNYRDYKYEFHKATVEDLIEHFKK